MSAEHAPLPAEVTYSGADIAAMNLQIWRWWIACVAILFAFIASVPIILGLVHGLTLGEAAADLDWRVDAGSLLFLLGWIVAVSVLAYWRRKRQGFLGPIQFALVQDGVSVHSAHLKGVWFWSAMRRLSVTDDRLFLFISRRAALIVPRRAFASDSDFDAFVAAARDAWDRARSR